MTTRSSAAFLDESQYDAWDAFVAASPQGSPYGTASYLAALCEAAGGRFRVLAARRGDEVQGGIALYERGEGSAVRIAPRPLLYYNGVVLRDFASKYPSQRTARILETSAAIETALRGAGYQAVVLKSSPAFDDARSFIAGAWNVRPGYSYVVPIRDLEAAWQRVEQNLRRLIRRCAEQGIAFGEDEDFDSFLAMHLATTSRKGLPAYLPQPQFRRFFERLHRQGLCRLFHARLPDGRAISSQLVLTGKHPVSHSVCAAADAEHLGTGATAFLRWKAFEALSAAGYAANDLTDAALNPVTHFKAQLGGTLALCLICERPPAASRWRGRLRAGLAGLLGR